MYFRKTHILLLLLLTVITLNSIGQEKQYWFTFETRIFLSQNFSFEGDMGTRHVWGEEYWHQNYIRPGVRYILNQNNSFTGGIAYFHTSESDQPVLHLIRPFQGYMLKFIRIFSIQLNHYFRIEEIFKFNDQDFTLDFRARYQLSTTIPIVDFRESKDLLSLSPGGELFSNLSKDHRDSFSDRYWFFLVLSYDISWKYSLDLTYFYSNTKDTYVEDFIFDTYILRVRFTLIFK